MDSLDLRVLDDAHSWHAAGHRVRLYTVLQTWGSAPRPAGALLAVRDDGRLSGSVSGGCVEDDLLHRMREGSVDRPQVLRYGVTREDAARVGLPCGGTLQLMEEPLHEAGWIDSVLDSVAQRQAARRTLRLSDGGVHVQRLALHAARDALARGPQLDAQHFRVTHGPRWRLLLIGAGALGQVLAQLALSLDFEVIVCDPRPEFVGNGLPAGATHHPGMPDDVVRALGPDARTAIVALTHDPKLDDLALLEALTSPAFYVGAIGSERHQLARRERLALHFGLSAAELARLHGPVGLRLGGKSPGEIAVSILAELVQVRHHHAAQALTHAPPTLEALAQR
jgi:xanthine dehydrogenase accessory factor